MVSLKNGERLKFNIRFTHQGAAAERAIRAAIGKRAVIGGFDEKLWQEITVQTDTDSSPQSYTATIYIPIQNVGTIGFPPGDDYEAYVKLMIPGFPPTDDIFWYGPENDIALSTGEEAVFSNLTVTYIPA